MTATIRNAIAGDEELLAKLNAVVHDVHLDKRPADYRQTTVAELATWYRSLLEASTARAWIAEHNDRPIGYVLAVVNRRAENPFCPARLWWELVEISVEPMFRRQGVGRALVHRAIAEATKLGITSVEAQSMAFNQEAHELLRDIGFVPKSIRFELAVSREP